MGDGRRWTYTDFELWLKEDAEEQAYQAVDGLVPPHWPLGVDLDSKRHAWLPADWGQGTRVTQGGNTIRVFVNPQGRMFYNKRDVEKELGKTLEAARGPTWTTRRERREKGDAPPRKDWPEWLPRDWTMGLQMCAGTLRPRYFSPDGQGFYNHRSVEAYIEKVTDPEGAPPPSPTPPSPAPPSAAAAAADSPSALSAAPPSNKRKALASEDEKSEREDAAGGLPEFEAEAGERQAEADGECKSGSPREGPEAADRTSASAEPNTNQHTPRPKVVPHSRRQPSRRQPSALQRRTAPGLRPPGARGARRSGAPGPKGSFESVCGWLFTALQDLNPDNVVEVVRAMRPLATQEAFTTAWEELCARVHENPELYNTVMWHL